MPRYSITLSYKGTNYHGWQIQDNAPTVQQFLNNSLSILLKANIDTVGAGRTDTGVHARHFIAHFDYEQQLPYPDQMFVFKLNSILPYDISVESVNLIADSFHARFDAKSRTYKYFISPHKNPFMLEFAYAYYRSLDIEAMNKAARLLYNYTDFTSFSKLHTDVKTNNCKITYAKWHINEDGMFVFTITADRFLRNMVRAIVGTLLEVGKGKLTMEDFIAVIEQKDRGKAGVSVPAQGLFLWKVDY